MNKAEMIEYIARSAEISKSAAERTIDALTAAIKTSLKKDQEVTLVGFGTFYAAQRAARTGRNPRTGAPVEIAASRVPRFRPGKGLRDALD